MSNMLNPGQSLFTNQSLNSNDGRFTLILQTDGNLVLYRTQDHRALWATGTNGQDTHHAIMQGDGNFVLYHENNTAAWASGTNGKPGSYLILQNDGNLVIYWPRDPVWASGTNQ
ncbi:hypothetical protein GCM10007874_06960 [Labrys miyagiensis]|uniref:Bulb-type lectin domain-containing protein n=1 Tax=Labrys miyagiensis TaxID=346912 RepID=A0ABQ6CBB0_9HYPH|nr:hypothetical protein [Labrys miyagiensis]GLS17681.1 hypothetical protein GCM10007874_06960 [Labrys miyagiensis]